MREKTKQFRFADPVCPDCGGPPRGALGWVQVLSFLTKGDKPGGYWSWANSCEGNEIDWDSMHPDTCCNDGEENLVCEDCGEVWTTRILPLKAYTVFAVEGGQGTSRFYYACTDKEALGLYRQENPDGEPVLAIRDGQSDWEVPESLAGQMATIRDQGQASAPVYDTLPPVAHIGAELTIEESRALQRKPKTATLTEPCRYRACALVQQMSGKAIHWVGPWHNRMALTAEDDARRSLNPKAGGCGVRAWVVQADAMDHTLAPYGAWEVGIRSS